ncbi:unnamed protein product [Thelazia callipaeda]|uniref:BTB domain-containing protein n=1 Tax=Thelazia callipaeda TaxID=103827 RepID=A0A0N5CLR1_THECL|nr:unnamed protein product [Thelazia callipaeda]
MVIEFYYLGVSSSPRTLLEFLVAKYLMDYTVTIGSMQVDDLMLGKYQQSGVNMGLLPYSEYGRTVPTQGI